MFTFLQSKENAVLPSWAYARLGTALVSLWYCSMGWLASIFAGIDNARFWAGPLATVIAAVCLLLTWRGHWRWGARCIVIAALALTAFWAWNAAFQPTISALTLTVLVVFAAWTLGTAEASLSILGVILLGAGLVYAGHSQWENVLSIAYVMLFLLGITWMMVQGYRRHLKELRASLLELEQHKKQLNVLFQAVEQSKSSILIIDAVKSSEVYSNQEYRQRIGGEHSSECSRVIGDGMTPAQRAQMWTLLKAGKTWEDVVYRVTSNAEPVIEQMRVAPVLGKDNRLAFLLETRFDITEKREAENRIRHLQHYDTLTELLNRKGLLNKLTEMLELQREDLDGHGSVINLKPYRSGHDWHSLLIIDIDRFQNFENSHNRLWADAFLQAFVARLKALQPEAEGMARIRDGRFAVVIKEVGKSRHEARIKAYTVAQELQRGLSMIQITGLPEGAEAVQLSCSVGFTVFPFVEEGLKSDSGDHVLRRAGLAMSQARHQGGDQVHAYSEVLDETMLRRMTIEKELFVAIQEGQLRVFLQPQVDMFGRVQGAEALVRWLHPEKGMISPGEFIPVAEDCGLIVPLGDWMLQQVCLLLNDPRVQAAGYSLSVNVSSLQFQHSDFVDKVKSVVQRTGIDPRKLILEVTESLLLSDVEHAIQKMVNLEALGVQFALDDFGTGYSSLAYLMRLPIQELKLDQVFIRDMRINADSRVLVESVLMLAKAKGLRVVSEGVQEQEQADLLRALEPSILCQGYWFKRPVLAEDWVANPVLAHQS